ncbi:hypothetical protein AAIH01_34295, partial [Pseudomonas aeruginosa]
VLTIRDPDPELIRQAKIATGRGTGSQALIASAEKMIHQREQIEQMQEQIAQMREQISAYQAVLADAHSAATRLAEVAGQGDIFAPSNPLRLGHRRQR